MQRITKRELGNLPTLDKIGCESYKRQKSILSIAKSVNSSRRCKH